MGCCWSDSGSEVEVPQARRRYEDRGTLITPRVSSTYVPTSYAPSTYFPSARIPDRVPTPVFQSARIPARVPSPAVPSARITARAFSPIVPAEQPKHCYGEYKCVCGRFWNSTLSWPKAPQGCQNCKRDVYPHTQRELRADDYTKDHDAKHLMELCPKCKELGRHCGILRKTTNNKNVKSKSYNNHCQYDSYNSTKRKRLGYHCSNSNRNITRGYKSVKVRY